MRVRSVWKKSSSIGEFETVVEMLQKIFLQGRIKGNASCFYSLVSFFKKRQQEKQARRPRGDGDDESVDEVDDEEFEKILGEWG